MTNYDNNINKEEKDKILQKLFALQRFGIKPGLERTLNLLGLCGNPHLKFPSIHIAGTNGKGSVCSMLASILTEAGYKTGLYTSPHILDFNERIRINGKMISDDELVKLARDLFTESGKIGCTFFEITTAMAFKYFADNAVDIAVIETGMGGRFDSTNVINPLVSVITSIGLDHGEYLGNTIEEIAFEKAGIIKPSVPVVISDDNGNIADIFLDKAEKVKTRIILAKNKYQTDKIEFSKDLTMTLNIKSENRNYNKLKIKSGGKHQIYNVISALAVLEEISGKYPASETAIRNGFLNIRENTGFKGRLELLRQKPPLIIDVAHNPASVLATLETLQDSGFKDTKWNIVFAAMSDKDILQMMKILHPICDKLILTALKIPRAENIEKLAEYASEAGFRDIKPNNSVTEAIHKAISTYSPLLIIGSFYLLEETLPELKKLFL